MNTRLLSSTSLSGDFKRLWGETCFQDVHHSSDIRRVSVCVGGEGEAFMGWRVKRWPKQKRVCVCVCVGEQVFSSSCDESPCLPPPPPPTSTGGGDALKPPGASCYSISRNVRTPHLICRVTVTGVVLGCRYFYFSKQTQTPSRVTWSRYDSSDVKLRRVHVLRFSYLESSRLTVTDHIRQKVKTMKSYISCKNMKTCCGVVGIMRLPGNHQRLRYRKAKAWNFRFCLLPTTNIRISSESSANRKIGCSIPGPCALRWAFLGRFRRCVTGIS